MSVINAAEICPEFLVCWLQVNKIEIDELRIKIVRNQLFIWILRLEILLIRERVGLGNKIP